MKIYLRGKQHLLTEEDIDQIAKTEAKLRTGADIENAINKWVLNEVMKSKREKRQPLLTSSSFKEYVRSM